MEQIAILTWIYVQMTSVVIIPYHVLKLIVDIITAVIVALVSELNFPQYSGLDYTLT